MAQIVVKLHGKEFITIDLVDGREYIAGRNQDCEIPLKNQKGISRNHLKISQINGQWRAELISRYGSLIYEGESAESVQLSDGSYFQIPPYEFLFVSHSQSTGHSSEPRNESKSQLSTVLSTSSQFPSSTTNASSPMGKTNKALEASQAMMVPTEINSSPKGNLETTSPGVTLLIPYLRIRLPGQEREQVLELEGHLWVAGRDAQCEICIEDGHVSRKHFELHLTNDGLYITDLGSANGTTINGTPLTPHEPHRIQSGDQISIMDLSIILEMRDQEFKNKLISVNQSPSPVQQAIHGPPVSFNPNIYFDPEGPSAVKISDPPSGIKGLFPWLKKNKIRFAIVTLIPILVLGFLFSSPPEKGRKDSSSTNSSPAGIDKLSEDQKVAVKDIFNLARGHYTQGRYELCLAELKKLHEIIPLYEDSKTLQAHCVQGFEMARENQELERKERARLEAQQKISFIVSDCQRRLGGNATIDQAKECLGPAIELDPSNVAVAKILAEIEAREESEQRTKAQVANRLARIKAGEEQYKRAKDLYKGGQLRDAINEYQKFLSGSYPDPNQLEKSASREIASIKKELDVKIQAALAECKRLYEKKELKAAIESCEKALKEDPNNQSANDLKSEILSDLRREMRSLYEDSILEESLGEIEGAKEKWRKIISTDIESDEYHQKAKRKLKTYGIGI